MKILINESERDRIKNLYQQKEKPFVFDFVITENQKYLIIMDQVFVKDGGGNTIGTIWEHTYIFNELIKESLSKYKSFNLISEEFENTITPLIDNIKWNKKEITEWVSDKNVNHLMEGLWDDIKSGAGDVMSSLGDAALNTAKSIFSKGVLPALRWVRRGLYTGVGIVVDVVMSIMAVKTNAIVWLIICALDIYEIATNDYDPQEPERKSMPFLLLIADIMGAVFSGGIGVLFKKSVPNIAKYGIKGAPKTLQKYLTMIGQKIPSLSSSIKNTIKILNKKMGPKSSGLVSTVLKSVDNVLSQLDSFLLRLFSKEGVKAGVTGGAVLGTTELTSKALEKTSAGNTIGNAALSGEKYLQTTFNKGPLAPNKMEDDAINTRLKELNL